MPRPCTCGRVSSLERYNKETDCAKCFMWETHEDYRKWHSGQQVQAKLPPEIKPIVNAGPGTELKRFLSWLGQVDDGKCGCSRFARKMDAWGPEGCRRHMGVILEKLQREAWKRSLPVPKVVLKALVRRAIRRAESLTSCQSDLAK